MTQALPMHPTLIRISDNGNETLGLLFFDGEFECFILEDEYRNEKVYGETRIPAGIYPLDLRTEGGHHNRYREKFPEMHEGMVHIKEVPNFKWILFHIGNYDEDTAGCLLPGNKAVSPNAGKGAVYDSTRAYAAAYPKIRDYIKGSPDPVIEIIDLDR